MRVSADLRKSVYPGISRNDNHWSGLVPRMLRSVIIARTRVCDAPWLAAWCAADPGSIESDWSRLRGAAQERRTASGTRCSCRPRVVRSKREYKCRDRGNRGAGRHWRGTGNEGVGEHVRTRFHLRLASPSGLEAGEIADRKDPHRTKKTCFFCRADLREERTLLENAIQPFDLMSRRHPLSSIEPSD
jgi:hypothetical protein